MKRKREPYNPLLKSYPDSERVNSVSIGAETLYTRLLAQSDDAAHYYGEPKMILAKLYTLRMVAGQVGAADVDKWVSELVDAGLVVRYESDGKRYLELVGCFKKLRNDVSPDIRFPSRSRRDDGPDTGRTRPDNPPSTQPNPTQPNPEGCTEPAAPASLPPSSPVVLTFPTIRGRKSKGDTWDLTEAKVAEWAETYPAVDVPAQCRLAWQWVMDNRGRRKTADGMDSFLSRWLSKEQNRGGRSGPSPGVAMVDAQPGFRNPTPEELEHYHHLEADE